MMKEFESGEMLRMPLDSVILMLKEILNEATTPALLDCLEPPDLSTIERSYQSLFKSNFITQPDDDGDITTLVRLNDNDDHCCCTCRACSSSC